MREDYVRRYNKLFTKLTQIGALPTGVRMVNPFNLSSEEKGIFYPVSTRKALHVSFFSWDGERLVLHDPEEGLSVEIEDYYELSQWLNDSPRVVDMLATKPIFCDDQKNYSRC